MRQSKLISSIAAAALVSAIGGLAYAQSSEGSGETPMTAAEQQPNPAATTATPSDSTPLSSSSDTSSTDSSDSSLAPQADRN